MPSPAALPAWIAALPFWATVAAAALFVALMFTVLMVLAWAESHTSGPAWHPEELTVIRSTPRIPGRHRVGATPTPYRDWAAVAAERINESHRRRYAAPVIAGPDAWDHDTHVLRTADMTETFPSLVS